MIQTLEHIVGALRDKPGTGPLSAKELDAIIRKRNRELRGPVRAVAKKQLLPSYQCLKTERPETLESWGLNAALEERLVRSLRMKPMRTASGVATVTVLTKPWPCTSACLYCPNDLRMPKSYLADEPACQRAERNYFDPYLQVARRLATLKDMGHTTDKVELIVLGGTWSDYPQSYRFWFARELFRALNEAGATGDGSFEGDRSIAERRAFYEELGIACEREGAAAFVRPVQERVNSGELTYNQGFSELYGNNTAWNAAAKMQVATLEDVRRQHEANARGAHRAVGLVIETRPDCISAAALEELRALGATKVQIGIQSLDERILSQNERRVSVEQIARAFALSRLYGFKTHAHFMANLYGSKPEADLADYRKLVQDECFLPDEVKLYPCALVGGTGLVARFEDGSWRPYTEDELVGLLAADVLCTPPYVRISRMIRDISSHDIMAGNKKVNLRQLVDAKLQKEREPEDVQACATERAKRAAQGPLLRAPSAGTGQAERAARDVQEIRSREIGTEGADLSQLALDEYRYESSVTSERFLQWVTPAGKIAGFLRLSLPKSEAIERLSREERPASWSFPLDAQDAMIREVHVYGAVAALGHTGPGAQHAGLGRQLIERACEIAREGGYTGIKVISAVGTREYYAKLGFETYGLYQRRALP